MKTTIEELAVKTNLPYAQVASGLKLMKVLGLAQEDSKIEVKNKRGRRKVVFEVENKNDDLS